MRLRAMAGIGAVLATFSCAAAEERRFGPFDSFFRPETYHELYGDLLRSNDNAELIDTAALGGAGPAAAARARIGKLDLDGLAEVYVRASDGVLGMRLARDLGREIVNAVETRIDQRQGQVDAMTTRLQMTDGQVADLSIDQAYRVHRAVMRKAATTRATGPRPGPAAIQLGPPSQLIASGTCPIASGAVELSRRGITIEGRRDDRLLLVGALGSGFAYFLLNELRYATVGAAVAAGPLRISIPDRPSTLYRAAMGRDTFELVPVADGNCRITIRPES